MNIRTLLVPLLAALGAGFCAPADDIDAWIAGLSKKSSARSSIPDPGDFGNRPGWISESEEARLLAPFASLTTEQARRAVPRLLELLRDETTVFSNGMGMFYGVRHRAHEALVLVSYRRIGAFSTGGELKPPEEYEREAREAGEALKGWPEWWEKNKRREISEWRRESVQGHVAAIRGRGANPDPATAALATLKGFGAAVKQYLTEEDLAEIAAAARDKDGQDLARIHAATLLLNVEAPEALDVAEELTRTPPASPSPYVDGGVLLLAQAGRPGIPRLIAVARRAAESAQGQLGEGPRILYVSAMQSLAEIAPAVPKMRLVPRQKDERVRLVEGYAVWWKGQEAK